MAKSSRKSLAESLASIRADYVGFSASMLKIKDKDSGLLVPFKMNVAQLYAHRKIEEQRSKTGRVRVVVSKGRQQGISTYTEGRFYWRVTGSKGKKAFILTHDQTATDNLFEMVETYHDSFPQQLKPTTGASNAKELSFSSLRSGYKVGTAGNKKTGRSSTIHFFHGCLGGEVLIVLPNGKMKPISEIEVGSEVVTHTGEFAPVTFKSEQTKQCLSVKMRGLTKYPLIATPEHRFWTRNGWMELRDLGPGDEIGYPVRKISNSKAEFPIDSYAPNRKQKGGSHHKPIVNAVGASYEWGRVLGLYLAEGYIALPSTGAQTPCAVNFTVHEKEVERTLEWLKPFEGIYSSITVSENKGTLTRHVIAYGVNFARTIAALCGRIDEKRLPVNWWQYGAEFGRGMLVGYLSGDGHVAAKERRIRATSTRESITIGMRDITASLGYGWASVEHKKAAVRYGRNEQAAYIYSLCGDGIIELGRLLGTVIEGRRKKASTGKIGNAAATTEISGGYAWVRIRSIEPSEEQTVYDLEIGHKDHSYCTIHGATHNSEVAFWPNADQHLSGILQAVPDAPGTEVILESTSNGVGGVYYDYVMEAMAGDGEYELIFVPWYWQPEYRKSNFREAGVRYSTHNLKLSEEETFLVAEYKLDNAQILWRRSKIHELKSEDLFKQEYPFTVMESFLASGRGVFAGKWLQSALDECFNPKMVASVDTIQVSERSDGELLVWDGPRKGGKYSIAADPAEGLAHGDWSTAQVVDQNGNQVAEYRAHVDPDLFAHHLKTLGKWYNKALLIVERNNHGMLVNHKLAREIGYPRLYMEEAEDHMADGKVVRKYGWMTTTRTKPMVIDSLVAMVRDGVSGIVSRRLIEEMQTYIVADNGSTNAQAGKHDDLLMAYAIVQYVHSKSKKKRRHTTSKTDSYVPIDAIAGF
jgi:hypothetical protein